MTAKTIASVLVALALALPVRAEGPKIVIGSKAFTESVILAEMLAALARDSGATVELKAELGGTQIVWQALRAGEIDAYVEYTGTLTNELLAGSNLSSNDEAGLRVAVEKLGLRMSKPLGFDNTYALGMRESKAAELKIESIADLNKHADLKYRFSDEFLLRADGWPGLQQRYRLPKQKLLGLDHGFIYRGLADGLMDVGDVYTTDAEIKQLGLRVLSDSKLYFPSYKAVILYRADVKPEVVKSLLRLEGKLDTNAMTDLNKQVQIDKQPDGAVAVAFLNAALGLTLPVPAGTQPGLWERFWLPFLQRGSEHLFLVAVSLALAILIAVPLGVLAFKLPSVGHAVLGVVSVVQTVPSLALLVFLLPLLGLGAWTAIAAMFLYSLLPIVRNTHTGLKTIPPALTEASQVLGLPWYARLWRVELPLASPSILAGIKIAAVVNVGTATIGALIGAGGYGQPILTGIRLYNIGLILQGAIPAALLALLVQGLFGLAEKGLVPRGLRLEAAR
jgi:osmoprotectant transport system permease protein